MHTVYISNVRQPLSLSGTELGNNSINEKEVVDIFKRYCSIMPNAI